MKLEIQLLIPNIRTAEILKRKGDHVIESVLTEGPLSGY